ncbi:MAG: DUF4340 domain-containing protein, partial [Acidobacteriota bacterium]
PADATVVAGLLGRLLDIEKSRTLEDLPRDQAGLEPPTQSITFDVGSENTLTLDIGAQIPGSGDRLIAIAGRDAVYQAPGTILAELDQPIDTWRDRQLLRIKRNDVERIEIRRPDAPTVVLENRDDGFWLVEPIEDRADRGAADRFRTALLGLRAESFLDDSTATAEPALEAILTAAGESTIVRLGAALDSAALDSAALDGSTLDSAALDGSTLDDEPIDLGGFEGADREEQPKTRHHVRVGTVHATVETALLGHASLAPEAWLDRAWTGLQVFNLDRATFTDDQGTVTLYKNDLDWRRIMGDFVGEDVADDGAGEKIDFTVASELLYALVELEADTVRDGKGLQLDPARTTLTIELEADDGRREILRVFDVPAENRVALTSSERSSVLVVAASAVETIYNQLTAVRIAEPVLDDVGE